MAHPFPVEVKKCNRPLDEEALRGYYHKGLKLITCVQTTPSTDPCGQPRYWYYFEVPEYVKQ